MSDDETPRPLNETGVAAGQVPAPGTSRPRRPARRTLGIGAGLAAIMLAAGVAAVTSAGGSGSEPEPIAATPLKHDPVPNRRITTHMPRRCGVSEKTIRELTPEGALEHAGESQTCAWSSRTDGGRTRRLEVGFVLDGRSSATGMAPDATPVSSAIKAFGTELDQRGWGAPKVITGLGDAAVAQYAHSPQGGKIAFRFTNAVVTVTYMGRQARDVSDTMIPEKVALDGALTAATDVAAALGAPTRSTLTISTPKARPPALAKPGDPCDLVPGKLTDDLLKPTGTPSPSGERSDAPDLEEISPKMCTWRRHGPRILQVSVEHFPDSTPGAGARQAERAYLKEHVEARGHRPISDHDERYFTALKGPGDQAFASYLEKSAPMTFDPMNEGLSPGRVVFRIRNVLVDVKYASAGAGHDEDAGEEPLTRNEAVNGAYEVAAHIAEELHP